MAKMLGKFRPEIQNRGFNIRKAERKLTECEIREAIAERQENKLDK